MTGGEEDEEGKGRAEDEMMEAEKGRMTCGFKRGVFLGGQEMLSDDWTTTANVIRETGKRGLGVSSGRKAGHRGQKRVDRSTG